MNREVEIFCCYAREDQAMLKQLKKHLRSLQRQNRIKIWSDTNIDAGANWEIELHTHLESADIILLLVSPDFINSDYCYSNEMVHAIERHKAGGANVIPIILRPVNWQKTPFAKLQALPKNAKPIILWNNKDSAFLNVEKEIERVVEAIHKSKLDLNNADQPDPMVHVKRASSGRVQNISNTSPERVSKASEASSQPLALPITKKRVAKKTITEIPAWLFASIVLFMGCAGFVFFYILPISFVTNNHSHQALSSPKRLSPTPFQHITPSPTRNTSPTPVSSPTVTPQVTPSIPPTWQPNAHGSLTQNNNFKWASNDSDCILNPDNYPEYYEQTDNKSDYCNDGSYLFTDMAYSIQMMIVQGNQAGIMCRESSDNYYAFDISIDGTYIITKHDSSDNDTFLTPATFSSAIKKGLKQENTLQVIAIGNSFELWINDRLVKSFNDDTNTQGTIGTSVDASPDQSGTTVVALFKNVQLLTPPN